MQVQIENEDMNCISDTQLSVSSALGEGHRLQGCLQEQTHSLLPITKALSMPRFFTI